MFKRLNQILTAAQAGWIASRCKTGCVIDDEKEEIRACIFHEKRIAELERKNKGSNG